MYKQLSALGFDLGERSATLLVDGDTLTLLDGLDHAAVVAELAPDALSDLVQDRQSTMGLAMTARVKIRDGSLDDWIRWEPADPPDSTGLAAGSTATTCRFG